MINNILGILVLTTVSACSSIGEVSFNKQEQVKSKDFNKLDMQWERSLSYTPTTTLKPRIISGGTNLPQFRAVPESEYWKGN